MLMSSSACVPEHMSPRTHELRNVSYKYMCPDITLLSETVRHSSSYIVKLLPLLPHYSSEHSICQAGNKQLRNFVACDCTPVVSRKVIPNGPKALPSSQVVIYVVREARTRRITEEWAKNRAPPMATGFDKRMKMDEPGTGDTSLLNNRAP